MHGPLGLVWEITARCTLQCAHCNQDAAPNRVGQDVSTALVLSYLETLRKAGVLVTFWDGGDPLLHPGFLEILSTASKDFCCYISTNGTALSEPYARELRKAKVAGIFLGLYGAFETTHDAHSRVPGSYAQALTSIGYLQANGLNPVLTMTLLRQNIGEAEEFVRLCDELHVRGCNFLRFYPIGRGRVNSEQLMPTYHQIQDFVSRISAIETRVPLAHPFFPRLCNCRENSNITFTVAGDATPCGYLRDRVRLGAIGLDRFDTIIERAAAVKKRWPTVVGRCTSCELSSACGGGCRAAVFEVGKALTSPDPACGYAPGESNTRLELAIMRTRKNDLPDRPVKTRATVVAKASGLVERYLDDSDSLYIYEPSSARLVRLNSAAAAVWALVGSRASIAELRSQWLKLHEDSGVPSDRLLADLDRVLSYLVEEVLLLCE